MQHLQWLFTINWLPNWNFNRDLDCSSYRYSVSLVQENCKISILYVHVLKAKITCSRRKITCSRRVFMPSGQLPPSIEYSKLPLELCPHGSKPWKQILDSLVAFVHWFQLDQVAWTDLKQRSAESRPKKTRQPFKKSEFSWNKASFNQDIFVCNVTQLLF